MLIVVSCAVLTLAALLYVFWLSPEPARAKTREERQRDYLFEKRAVIYENLRDLHLEYRMGKLSDQDYQQTKARYQEELAAVLHALEGRGAAPPAADTTSTSPPPPGRCLRCGRDNPPDNRFCGACGAALPAAAHPV